MQDELSQMHAEMIEKLANSNEAFCQKLHELCGVEVIKRFAVLFSQTQLAKIWPTVRMCRMKEAVNAGGWLQLTHEPSISFKNGEASIKYHDDDAGALAYSYKELFTNHELFSPSKSKFFSSTQHRQIQNMDILLKAAIWLGNNLIDELLLFVDTILTLFRLMKRLTQFRNIFSGSAQYVEAIKSRLFVVLGSPEEFELLENMFPEHLHIDWLDKGYRVALYSNMLQQRSWSDEAQRAEMRMTASMLLQQLNAQLSVKTSIGTIDPMDVIRMHEIVKTKVYANIDKVEGVCWMMYLLNLMSRENATFIMPSEPLIEYCVHERAKFELCKQHKEVCQYDASNKAFDDETVLMYHYRRSIVFSEKVCANDRLSSKLAADMLVFIRWFDAEPKSAKMATFWRAKREEFKDEYDEIFDSCHSMRKLLIECRNLVNEKEMKEAWKKMLKQLDNNDPHRMHSAEGGADRQRYAAIVEKGKDWLNNLHAEELKKFLGFTNDEGPRYGFANFEKLYLSS
uniref:RING-type domain-containing protein n=1 Tax=Globodera pallida TaxID=36090 RepID=A0A183CA37_GLOPA